MPHIDLQFRPATPADVNEAIPLIYASGPDVCEYIFKDLKKGSAEKFLHYAFQKSGGETSYTNHICATIGGKVVGIGAIWSGKDNLKFMLREIRNIFGFYGFFRGIGVLIRGLKSEFLMPPPKSNEYTLGHLGIDASLRGKGVGTLLIQHLMNQVNLNSTEKIILYVSFINPKAQKLYERLGFVVTKTNQSNLKRSKLGIEVPGHYRMERQS